MDNAVKAAIPISILLVVLTIMFSMFGGWDLSAQALWEQEGKRMEVKQLHINQRLLNHSFPKIIAENQRIQQGQRFSIREHVRAIDHQDGDISDQLTFYGEVDTNKKGIYTVRCVVRNSLGMKSVKHILVLVD